MTVSDDPSRTAGLKQWAHEARARSAARIVQAAEAAESAALMKDQVECMIDRVAERNPRYAAHLYAISRAAARPHAGATTHNDDPDVMAGPGGPGSLPLPEPWNGAGARVVSGMEAYLRDMAIVHERDHMISELRDKVIKRIFAAGLTLDGAAGLTTQPEVRRRIEAAATQMDELIRVIRDAVFSFPGPPDSHEPGSAL